MARNEQVQGRGDIEEGFQAGSRRVAPISESEASNADLDGTQEEVVASSLQNKERILAEKILKETYPNNPELVEAELQLLDESIGYLNETVDNDINGKDAFNIELEVPDLISEPQLQAFFKKVLNQYSAFSKAGTLKNYADEPKDWFESKANRGRLVLTEAADTNLSEIAKSILSASPLENIVTVGLDEQKQAALKNELVAAWETKISTQENSEAYREKIMKVFSENAQEEVTDLNTVPLSKLMGPHSFTENADISFSNLSRELGSTFHLKIDEMILYGDSPSLAGQLPELAKKSGVIQSLAIKASPFEATGNSPLWTAALDGVDQPFEHLTSAKNPEDILGEGKFQLNPNFEQVFNDKVEEHGLSDLDAKFLKDMFISKSLYMNNLSPQLYATTITKAQSGLNGKGAIVVGDALPQAAIGRVVATAFGARFAVNSTMIDTANDYHQEDQEKMLPYRELFNDLLIENINNNKENPLAEAMDKLCASYGEIEHNPDIVNNENKNRKWRVFALSHANETNKKNEAGIKWLKVQPLAFLYASITTPLGVGLAAASVATSIAFPITGASVFLASLGTLTTSLYKQKAANSKHMSRWHRASARARTAGKTCQDLRDKLVSEKKEELLQSNRQGQGLEVNENLTQQQAQSASVDLGVAEEKKAAQGTEVVMDSQEKIVAPDLAAEEGQIAEPLMAEAKESPGEGPAQESKDIALRATVTDTLNEMVPEVEKRAAADEKEVEQVMEGVLDEVEAKAAKAEVKEVLDGVLDEVEQGAETSISPPAVAEDKEPSQTAAALAKLGETSERSPERSPAKLERLRNKSQSPKKGVSL